MSAPRTSSDTVPVAGDSDGMSRRDLLRRALYVTGGVAVGSSLLSSFACAPAAQQASATTGPPPAPKPAPPVAAPSPSPAPPVAASPAAARPSPAASPAAAGRSPLSVAANDPAIEGQDITFPGPGGATLMAYQVRPRSASGPLPVVLVCHQNRGLNDHIRDVTRRFAKEGYLACAVDQLSRQGGTSQASAEEISAASRGGSATFAADFVAAIDFYRSQAAVARPDRIGMIGFCFGGDVTWRTATLSSNLRAATPFYGGVPPLEDVPKIRAAVFGVYSSDPADSANRRRDELEAALKSASVTYQMKEYPGTRHGFNDDTSVNGYNQEQALAAWKDTLDWFAKYLKA